MNSFKKFLQWYSGKRWVPLLFIALSLIVTIFNEIFSGISQVYRSYIISPIIDYFVLTSFLGIVLVVIFNFFKKRWKEGVIQFAIGSISFIAGLFVYNFIALVSSEDGFADNLKIPNNIEINIPHNLESEQFRPDSIFKRKVNNPDFLLYNSFQGGIYEYDIWFRPKTPGTIYLKAFEITKNRQLSTDRLKEQSAIRVNKSSDSIQLFQSSKSFTIYEGDWEKYYAARFEVWFIPDSGKEIQLLRKNYKIDGWQR